MHSPKSKTEDPKIGTFRVEFLSNGAKPPVFIAGTFTNPPWQLLEMKSFELNSSDKYRFEIRLDLTIGQDYQYKFRLGKGEHWDLNEEEPIVEDEAGNRNNLLPTGRNKNGWKEKVTSNSSEEVIEERILTKFTAEERQKRIDTSRENPTKIYQSEAVQNTSTTDLTYTQAVAKDKKDHTEQQQKQQNLTRSNDEPRKYISDIRITETGILVPEAPRDPTPTPTADMKQFNGHAEINFQNLKNNKLSLSNSPKIDKKNPDRDSFKPEVKNEPFSLDGRSDKISRQQIDNLDIANTAAEVADMATLLDQEPPSPPVSDKEAGQIGLRRLSSTPIPEVARVAAEVADVAALLDDESSTGKTPRQLLDEEAERLFGSGHTTPIEERVPRFSHEFPVFPDPLASRKSQSDIFIPSLPQREEIPDDFDLDDPSIKIFPTDRASIMAKIREIQERLPEDEACFEEGPPISSGVLPDNWSMNKLASGSPKFSNGQPQQSLQAITEEDDSKSEDPLTEVSSKKERSFVVNGQNYKNDEQRRNTIEPEARLNGHNIENDHNDNKKPSYASSEIFGEKDGSSTESHKTKSNVLNLTPTTLLDANQYSMINNEDISPNQEISDVQISGNLANGTTSENKTDTKCINNHNNQVKSTGFLSNGTSSTTFRDSKSSQITKTNDQENSTKTINNTTKDIGSKSFLDLIWHLLLLDWISSILKWLWGSKKHEA